jgi:sulfatase maturation enzyme AslB (radical SAM superfamily)
VDDETINVVLETKTHVSVSIDGPRRFHNDTRVDTAGRRMFSRALAGYRKLQEAGVNPGISCTLSVIMLGTSEN